MKTGIGAVGPTVERLALATQARLMRGDGMLYVEIAEALGVSYSYASDLVRDPTGAKARKRKEGLQGRCENCGGPTSPGNHGVPSRHCARCAINNQLSRRYWTRERCIEAIQRWAREHDGVPPTSTEWQRAGAHHPPRTAVYWSSNRHTQPFKSWAEAIEAAGFPRPQVGKRSGQRCWTREGIIEAIQVLSENGIAPAYNEDRSLTRTAITYFGSWLEAVEAAGVTPRSTTTARSDWTREKVIERIQEAAVGGLPPLTIENRNLAAHARRLFGSWSAAVTAAGLTPIAIGNTPISKRRRELLREVA